MEARKKVTLSYILEKKANGEKLARTALYDYPMAVLAEEAGIEIINMGDSIATVMLGHKTTNEADLDIMIEHAKAVRAGTPSAFIMGDMPFLSYQISDEEAIRNAGRYIREAGMDCVKVEGKLHGDRPYGRSFDEGRYSGHRTYGPDPAESASAGGIQDTGA